MKLAHFYHVMAVNDWPRIVGEHIDALVGSGLAEEIGILNVGIVGAPAARNEVAHFCASRIPTRIVSEADTGWEQVTQNAMYDAVAHSDDWDAVLYAHTKGVFAATDQNRPRFHQTIGEPWRKSMTLGTVWGWRACVRHMEEGYNSVGCHWITPSPELVFPEHGTTSFYGGTFWWATTEYMRGLPPPEMHHRHCAEHWIGQHSDRRPFDLAPGMPDPATFLREIPA